MIGLTTKLKAVMLGTIVFGVALFVVLNFTGVSRLEAVVLDGNPVEEFEPKFGLVAERTTLKQPLDSLCQALLARDDIVKVDIGYRLPNKIDISTNQFSPACFVLDKRSGKLMGLTDEGRVVPIPAGQTDWERPMITGVKADKLYGYCSDVRVRMVARHLEQLRDDHTDFFRLIAELDFSDKQYILATISGLQYRLRLSAERFIRQLSEFIQFLERYSPDLSNTTVLDMRYDYMIIQVGKGQ